MVAFPVGVDNLDGHALVLEVVIEGGAVVQVLHERVAHRLDDALLEESGEELEEGVELSVQVVDEGLQPEDGRVFGANRAQHIAEDVRRQLALAYLAARVDNPASLERQRQLVLAQRVDELRRGLGQTGCRHVAVSLLLAVVGPRNGLLASAACRVSVAVVTDGHSGDELLDVLVEAQLEPAVADLAVAEGVGAEVGEVALLGAVVSELLDVSPDGGAQLAATGCGYLRQPGRVNRSALVDALCWSRLLWATSLWRELVWRRRRLVGGGGHGDGLVGEAHEETGGGQD